MALRSFRCLACICGLSGGLALLSGCAGVGPQSADDSSADSFGADSLLVTSDVGPAAPDGPTADAGNSQSAGAAATTTSTSSSNNAPPPGGGTPSVSTQKPPAGTDLNGDGVVNQADINLLLSLFGPAKPGANNGDTNGDGFVDLQDLGYLISVYQ